MVEWKISNAVFSLKFDMTFSLDKMAKKLMDYYDIFVYYEPNSFPGLIIKIENNNEKHSITLFRTGMVNISGIRGDINKIYNVIKQLRKILQRCDIDLPDPYQIKLSNVIINGKFDYNFIDIERIYNDFDDAHYDPHQFPAVSIHYNISNGYKVAFNVFRNGSFIGAGFKGDFNDIHQHIDEIVNSFQKNVIKKYAKA